MNMIIKQYGGIAEMLELEFTLQLQNDNSKIKFRTVLILK